MRDVVALVAVLAVAGCGALQLPARAHAPRVGAVPARVRSARAAETAEEPVEEAFSAEEMAAIKERELADQLMVAAGGDSDFVRWYRYEKAKEDYLKENPKDPLGDAADRLKGPATSLLIITAGFYSIPLIKGIADGIQGGDLVGALSDNLSKPTEVLQLPGS